MLIDLHTHSSGISRCCRQDAPGIIKSALDAGLDGIVLTNHYQEAYVTDGDARAFAEKYIAEYHYAKEAGDALGAKVFFGIEVTLNCDARLHMLVYGVSEEFLLDNPKIYELSPVELYALVHEAGGVLVQGHPFRNGSTILDTDYLDGLEVNCHPIYGNAYTEEIAAAAVDAGIMVTCGGDYHADTAYRASCGVYLPEDTESTQDIARFIRTAPAVDLRVHEVNAPEADERHFEIKRKKG